jgi:SAM-dependent methyltransferase
MHKQVDKSHYEFKKYMQKRRWASMWHQLDEVLAFEPKTVLEVGPGPGVFKALTSHFGPSVETLDIDPELEPDHVASADNMPFGEGRFDVVCAFQMLEHVPYDVSLAIFKDMVRVASKGVVISLPDAKRVWPYSFHVPKVGTLYFHLPRPRLRPQKHIFDGQHHWEINKAGYSLSRVVRDLEQGGGVRCSKTYRVGENPYHRFFVFTKG